MVALLGQAHVGIVLAQQDAVLGTRGEHAVGFVHAAGHKVIDEHTDVRLVAGECERLSSCRVLVGVNAGNESLSCRFFISRCAVDLSGEEEIFD